MVQVAKSTKDFELYIAVAQEFLNKPNIFAILQEMCGE